MSTFEIHPDIYWTSNRALFRRFVEDLIVFDELPQEVGVRMTDALESGSYFVSVAGLEPQLFDQFRTVVESYIYEISKAQPADFPVEEAYHRYLKDLENLQTLLGRGLMQP